MATHLTHETEYGIYKASGGSATPAAKLFGHSFIVIPPTVTLVSPADGSQLAPNDAVVIDITVPAPATLRLVVLSVAFPTSDGDGSVRPTERIYSSSRGNDPMYPGVTIDTLPTGVRVTMKRLGGWPSRGLRFDPDVVTSAGAQNP